MPLSGYLIDSNILLLLVVGRVSRELISKHRRLEGFSAEDYDILTDLLQNGRQVFVTPNILTETSNLLGQHREPERSRLFQELRSIILDSEEVMVASATASGNRAFSRLGLTDATLLEAVSDEIPLLTVDHNLHKAALEAGSGLAVNFTAFRGLLTLLP